MYRHADEVIDPTLFIVQLIAATDGAGKVVFRESEISHLVVGNRQDTVRIRRLILYGMPSPELEGFVQVFNRGRYIS